MPRRNKIRWRESDAEKLRKAVKNFNARVAYVLKTNEHAKTLDAKPDDLAKGDFYIPNKQKYNDVLASIETRKDFNRVIKSLERFNAKTSKPVKTERSANMSKYLYDEARYKQQALRPIMDEEAKRIAALETKIAGEPTGNTRKMGDIKKHQTRAHERNVKNLSKRDLPIFFKNLDNLLNAQYRKEQREMMRENYIKGLTLNGFLDENPEIEEYIRGVDIDTFYDNAITDDTATFYFYKDPIAFEVRKTAIVNTWKAAYEAYKRGENIVAIYDPTNNKKR